MQDDFKPLNKKALPMKLLKCFSSIAVLLLFVGCTSTKTAIKIQIGQSPHSFSKQITKTARVNYLLFLPQDYEKDKRLWPLMVFLHGAGERGDNVELVKRNGPPKIVEEKKDFPFILISPQCPQNEWWSFEMLNFLIDEIISQYRVDEDRIYLTGLSMGGYGTWHFAVAYPERFAAIAPICGGGPVGDACKIRGLPVWVFHGARDNVVPIEQSEEMVTALKECGGDVKFTVYPETGHDSWVAAYNNLELYDWFLSHRRSANKGKLSQ
jgi:predicted peptidase